jgi:hypothetical protein
VYNETKQIVHAIARRHRGSEANAEVRTASTTRSTINSARRRGKFAG